MQVTVENILFKRNRIVNSYLLILCSDFVLKVEMHKCFRPGDVIVARVVSLLANRKTGFCH